MRLGRAAINLFKPLLKATFFRSGSLHRVWAGPLRGAMIRVNPGMGWAVLHGGWEPALQRVYSNLVVAGMTVYDLGANTGIHSLLFSRLVGKAGRVIAFEPLPNNVLELRRILQENAVTNVEIQAVAVSNRDADARFLVGKHDKQGSLTGIGCESGVEIEVTTVKLDTLTASGLPDPDFLKIDIEGGEADALEGALSTLERSRPFLAIELHTPEQDVQVGRHLKSLGYRAYRMARDERDLQHQGTRDPRIKRLDLGWPHPEGIWGAVLAGHPERIKEKSVLSALGFDG